jgi:pimeloyl-ACP methyl ester carboxylesterase
MKIVETHQIVVINGVKTHRYLFSYSQKPSSLIILFHGWNKTGSQSWLPFLRQISMEHRDSLVLMCETPGMGKSSEPPKIWDVFDFRDWGIENILHTYHSFPSIQSISVVGHSFGGVIATLIAAKSKLSISQLLLLAPALIRTQKNPSYIHSKILSILKPAAQTRLYSHVQRIWRYIVGSKDYRQTSPVMREVFGRIIRQDTSLYLRKVSQPTTIIWGSKDTYTPISQLSFLKKIKPDIQTCKLSGINHGIHLHAPEIILESLKKTLAM